MNKDYSEDPDQDMPDEVDFSGGVRGRYADRFGGGRNIVVLEPDVAEVFKNSAAVNKALRTVIAQKAKTKATSRKRAS
jgi:hypothetical protein